MMAEELSRGMLMVIAERREQVDLHGYDAAHDDEHGGGELIRASMAYTAAAGAFGRSLFAGEGDWPWASGFKPSEVDPRKDLAKAAAFLVAEIDRITRLVGHCRGGDVAMKLAEAAA